MNAAAWFYSKSFNARREDTVDIIVPEHISRDAFLDIQEVVVRYLKHKLHGKLLTHAQGQELSKSLTEEIELKAD